jgi:hypothetical protein
MWKNHHDETGNNIKQPSVVIRVGVGVVSRLLVLHLDGRDARIDGHVAWRRRWSLCGVGRARVWPWSPPASELRSASRSISLP